MLKTIKQACSFNPIIQDYRMSLGIENLANLINDAGDGREFFSRNYVTHGMEQLFREGMPKTVIQQFQQDLPDFMEVRSLLIDVLGFMEKKAPEVQVREAAEVLGARLKNLRALGQ